LWLGAFSKSRFAAVKLLVVGDISSVVAVAEVPTQSRTAPLAVLSVAARMAMTLDWGQYSFPYLVAYTISVSAVIFNKAALLR